MAGRGALATAAALAALLFGSLAAAQVLEVTLSADSLTLGRDESAEVRVELLGESSDRIPWIRLSASVGEITRLGRAGRNVWTGTYTPPRGRSPRIALILARGDSGSSAVFGGAVLPLVGTAELPFRTEPGATVTARIAGREFGPVRAGRDGIARLPVEVPPGSAAATAESVDPVGNRTEVEIPLEVPAYPRVLLEAPARVTAGETCRLAAIAVDRSGALTRRLETVVSRGRVQPVRTGPVVVVYELVAPDRVGSGELAVETTVEGDREQARSVAEVAVVPREPARISLTADRETFVPGTHQAVTVWATVRDRHGNVRPGDPVSLTVDGLEVAAEPAPEGGLVVSVPAPPAQAGLGRTMLRARSGELESVLAIERVGGPAALARLEVPERAVADGRTVVPLRVTLIGETGLAASEAPVVRASVGSLRRLRREADGSWLAEYVPPRGRLGWPARVDLEAGRGPALARARVRLSQPEPWLSAELTGGVQANLGALVGPASRLELASRFRVPLGWLEVAVFSGFSFGRLSSPTERGLAALRLWQVPFAGGFGWGVRLGRWAGMSLSTRGGAVLVVAEDASSFQPHGERLSFSPFVEGSVGFSFRLLLGEIVARLGYAYAPAPEGSDLSGNLLGLSAHLGYRLYLL